MTSETCTPPCSCKNETPSRQTATQEATPRTLYAPRADLFENETALVLQVDLPGVSPEGLDLTVEKDRLTIRGTPADQSAGSGFQLTHAEYPVGNYERIFKITGDFDVQNIDAVLKHGILTIQLPKAQQALARKVAVRTQP